MVKRPTLEQLLVTIIDGNNCEISFNTENDSFPKDFRSKCIRLNDLYMQLLRFDPNVLSRHVYKIYLKYIDNDKHSICFDIFLMNDETDPLN